MLAAEGSLEHIQFGGMITVILLSVLYKTGSTNGYTDAIYTWPLSYDNPLYNIQNERTNGVVGDFVTQAKSQPALQYKGIALSDHKDSYVEFIINNSSQFEDFAFAVFAFGGNAHGATLMHYKQDDSSVNPSSQKIKDVIIWYGKKELVFETLGPNNENYGYCASVIKSSDYVHSWVGFAASYNSKNSSLNLLTSTGIDKKTTSVNAATLGCPGRLRIGASFNTSRLSYFGEMICLNMYDTLPSSDDFPDILNECNFAKWNDTSVTTQSTVLFTTQVTTQVTTPVTTSINTLAPSQTTTVSTTNDESRGFFEVKHRGSAIDETITSLSIKATTSRVKCAQMCMHIETCSSFSINKLAGVCKLFDSDYSANIISCPNTNYYMRR